MIYYDGAVFAVPQSDKQAAIDFWQKGWPNAKQGGARRLVVIWGEDVPRGTQTDFWQAVAARDDEAVAVCWYEWPDQATADAFWNATHRQAEAGTPMPHMPLDGKRAIFGGFTPVLDEGDDRASTWYWAFMAPVPTANHDAFQQSAQQGWRVFRDAGANRAVDTWPVFVPHGTVTDMWRAVDAREGEVVAFSWVGWPDRVTADAAQQVMMNDPAMAEMQLPFDGARMIWGGFARVVDQRA